ncbi:YveK family protein [Alkalicoccus chagannorensis]|uniref:YveK family protein n=1 Tax=Alkalicoccus chagannorensis TaxID=427072 RepID=UPI000421BFDA|nr:hypothetical protein [Alkalicoccus chagannorensis]
MGEEEKQGLRVRQVIRAVRRRWSVIVVTTLAIGGLLMFYMEQNQLVHIYGAQSSVIVTEENVNMNTMTEMINEPLFMDAVIEELSFPISHSEMAERVTSTSGEGSDIIQIDVEHTSAENAVEIANTITEVFPGVVSGTIGNVEVLPLSTADVQVSLDNPVYTPTNNLLIFGTVLGLLLGIGLALLLDALDDKIRGERDIERAVGLPVIAGISRPSRRVKEPDPAAVESSLQEEERSS